MLNVGLVIEHFDPARGGAEFWTFQHALQLLRDGHEVHIVTTSVSEAARKHPFVVHLMRPTQSRLERGAEAQRVLRTLRLHVVHDIGLGWHCDLFQSEDGSRLAQWEHLLAAWPAAARPAKRWLYDVLPRYAEFRALMQRQYAADERLVVAVSHMCARDYHRLHGVSPDRIRVIYHGVNTEHFSPRNREAFREPLREQLGVHPNEVLFLFVGHDFVRKGLNTAVRAVRRLAARGWPARLLVVGGRRSGARSAPLASRDTFLYTGRVPDCAPYYAAADAFVLPTFYDPCSLSVGEAAASGLPVVTTACNGAAELLTSGKNGYILANPADDAALAQHLERLCDANHRQQLGAAARTLAEAYPLQRNYRELLNLYRDIAAAKRGWRFPAVPQSPRVQYAVGAA